MPRLFAEHGLLGAKVLPIGEAKLFSGLGDFDAGKAKWMISRAERELDEEIPLCPASLYIQFAENGNRSNYEAVYFKRRGMMIDLALAEHCEGKGRFSLKLMDVVWAILEESSWTIPAHLGSQSPTHGSFKLPAVFDGSRVHALDLFSASTAASLAFVYAYAKDALDAITPVICEKLKALVLDRQIKPFISCPFGWEGRAGNRPNNWNPWIHSNILYAAAVLADDDYVRAEVVHQSMRYLDNFTNFYMPDGGCDEGPSYWTAAGASYFDCLETLYDLTGGAVDLYGDPLVRAMCEYEAKMYINGKRFANFADCPPNVHPDGAQLVRMGEKCGSELLVNFGRTMTKFGTIDWNSGHIWRGVANMKSNIPVAEQSLGATKVWLGDLKVMAAREYPETDKGLYCAMKGGCNAESHNHNDVGNIIVYANGNPVLIDTGAGRYTKKTFSAQRYELWFMQSSYHNLPEFGGVAQLPGGKYASVDEVYDEAAGGVSMELKNAYPEEAGLLSYVRSCVLADGAVRVTERVSLAEKKEIDFHFITHIKPELTDGGILLAEGKKLVYDEALAPEIEAYAADDPGIEHNWGAAELYRIHLRTVAKSGEYHWRVE